jgi:hypothetical protein
MNTQEKLNLVLTNIGTEDSIKDFKRLMSECESIGTLTEIEITEQMDGAVLGYKDHEGNKHVIAHSIHANGTGAIVLHQTNIQGQAPYFKVYNY